MKRPVCKTTPTRYSGPHPAGGYTLMEILVATALMLTIMLAVAWVFGMVGETIADSRSSLEMTSQLRSAAAQLTTDLNGVTVTMLPPRDPGANEGYFEITEGAVGAVIPSQVFNPDIGPLGEYEPFGIARNLDRVRVPTANDPDQIGYEVDTTVGDSDDILMFTTRGSGESFIGRCVQKRAPIPPEVPMGMDDFDNDGTFDNDYVYNYGTIVSDLAEVIYFVRGRTLYRRVLLVAPDFPRSTPWLGNMDIRNDAVSVVDPIHQLSPEGFYNNDVSVRLEQRYDSTLSPPWKWVLAANTLGDLTKRESRFAHRVMIPSGPRTGQPAGFPYHPHWWTELPPTVSRISPIPTFWGTHYTTAPFTVYPGLGLPTLQECSHAQWAAGGWLPNLANTIIAAPLTTQLPLTPVGVYDAWTNPHPYQEQVPPPNSTVLDTGALHFPALIPRTPPPFFLGPRVGEDVVLTNVIGFDVKVWDPKAWVLPATDARGTQTDLTTSGYWGTPEFIDDRVIAGVAVVPGDPGYELALAHAIDTDRSGGPSRYRPVGKGAYVDLNYLASININLANNFTPAQFNAWLLSLSTFVGPGNWRSQLPRVYDTWSTHYESNWFDRNLDGVKNAADWGDENRNGLIDEGSDGMDNPIPLVGPANGIVDDAVEQEAPAPYPVPLRGIQIKIRVFDPDSRQVRERTIVHDFLPK